MWIMECGIEGKLVVKIVYNKFEFSKKMFYIHVSIWYNEIRNIVPFLAQMSAWRLTDGTIL